MYAMAAKQAAPYPISSSRTTVAPHSVATFPVESSLASYLVDVTSRSKIHAIRVQFCTATFENRGTIIIDGNDGGLPAAIDAVAAGDYTAVAQQWLNRVAGRRDPSGPGTDAWRWGLPTVCAAAMKARWARQSKPAPTLRQPKPTPRYVNGSIAAGSRTAWPGS